MPQLETLKIRAEFLRLRGSKSVRSNFCGVQGINRGSFMQTPEINQLPPRIGFIITKKIGNAVVRNRIRRRLKAILAQLYEKEAVLHIGWDYIFFPKPECASIPFEEFKLNLINSLKKLKA